MFSSKILIVFVINSIILGIKGSEISPGANKYENTANCGLSKTNAINAYIIGGSEASGGQFPWMVSLQRRMGGLWTHTCGAVIINKDWILTAAHCINGVDESSVRALVGTHLLDVSAGSGQTSAHEITKIIKHESYSAESLANDLALIQVKTELNLDNSDGYVNSVCLPAEGQKFTQYVTQSGWGSTVSAGHTASNKLMFVNDVPIVSLPKCRSIYGFNAIREGMLCAGAPMDEQQPPKGSCQGDSGGPLIQKDPSDRAVLVGISSFNRRCASPDGTPDVFVEISYYRNWIDENAVNSV